MGNVVHSALGIEPGVHVVGSSLASGRLLLRTKTTHGRTLRYVACYDLEGKFKYFRRVSSSERKRLGRGEVITSPLEQLDWLQESSHWCSQWHGKKVSTLTPYNLVAPTDYSTYTVGSEMVSNLKLKEMITNADHNY